MAHLQTFIGILNIILKDVVEAEGMTPEQRKNFASSIITNLVMTNTTLTDEEKGLINLILPLLINDGAVIEAEVKGCFTLLFGKCCKK